MNWKNLAVLLISAASAVLAHGFVNQGIEFAARQRHIIAGIFSAVASDGQFRSSARRWRNKIAWTRGHEFGDVAAGGQGRLSGHFPGKRDVRARLDGPRSRGRGWQR